MTSFIDFSGTISDGEMWEPSLKTRDQDNNPCIMVIKSGNTSDLTIGRLNTIRSCCRVYFEGQPGQVSKEVSVLPRNSENSELCASSEPGDSGSAVVDDKGRLAGLLTGGAGDTSIFDCTYLTSINFLPKRILEYGLKANLYPPLVLKCHALFRSWLVVYWDSCFGMVIIDYRLLPHCSTKLLFHPI